MAKNHFSGVQNGSESVEMGVLGGVFVLKSGLRILIRALEVPSSESPKWPKTAKMTHFGRFGGYQKCQLVVPSAEAQRHCFVTILRSVVQLVLALGEGRDDFVLT